VPHYRKLTALSSTFGFCEKAQPTQETKEFEFCQCSAEIEMIC
jgi:hypothetical protein